MNKIGIYVWNSILVIVASLGVFGYMQLEENVTLPGALPWLMYLFVIPVFLALLGSLVLRGSFVVRIISVASVPIIAGVLFGLFTATKSPDSEAIGYLMIYVILMLFMATFAVFLTETVIKAFKQR